MVISISFKIKCTAFFQNSKSVRPPAELVRLLTELARLPADFRFKIQELVRLLADSRFQISDFRFQNLSAYWWIHPSTGVTVSS